MSNVDKMREALRELLKKWREIGNESSPARYGAYTQCARELEAALSDPAPAEQSDSVTVSGVISRSDFVRSDDQAKAEQRKAIATAPERIYLQIGELDEHLDEEFPHHAANGSDEVTWCADSVLAAEVPYVRADLSTPQPAPPVSNVSHSTPAVASVGQDVVMVPRAELRAIFEQVEALKRPCGMDPETPQAIRNGEYASIAHRLFDLLSAPSPHEPQAVPDSAYAKVKLGPIETCGDFRSYIPLPGGCEVQTKGDGSSFRIVVGIGTPDEYRLNVPDQPYVHETLERMARDIHAAVARDLGADDSVRVWQPIESVPKDGTRVIVSENGGNDCYVAWWTDSSLWKCIPTGFERVYPTLWTPLPARAAAPKTHGDRGA